jgi:hypothetical protein
MPPLDIPRDVEAVFREFRTCEFTTVNRALQPLTWPTETHFLHDEGQIVVTSSIAFPVKAYNARRYPKVSLLYSDPTGSGVAGAPAVLVQGDTTVRELIDDPPWSFEMFKESVERQPNTRKFVGNPIAQRMFLFQYQRLAITVTPRRIRRWPGRDFSLQPVDVLGGDLPVDGATAPVEESGRAWNADLIRRARAYPRGVLTIVEPSGYPASVRCRLEIDEGRSLFVIADPPPGAEGWRGKASLLFHRHDANLGGQHEMMLKGALRDEGGLVFQPAEFLTASGSMKTDTMPVSGSMLQRIQFMLLGQRKAKEYLKKRGEPWPPRPFKLMMRYLEEGPSALQQ